MPFPVKDLLEVHEDMVEILLMLQVFLAEDPEIKYLFFGAPFGSEICLLFCNDLFCLWLESVYDLQLDLTRMADKADGSVVLAQLQVAFLWECATRECVHVVGHSPVLQILLQIAVRMSIMASPPAWTDSAGMLSMPADFPIFSALTAASTSSRRIV